MLTAVANIPSRTSLQSAGRGDLLVPTTRLEFGERAFSVSGRKVSNDLPAELKTCRRTVNQQYGGKTIRFNQACGNTFASIISTLYDRLLDLDYVWVGRENLSSLTTEKLFNLFIPSGWIVPQEARKLVYLGDNYPRTLY
jgi:hypothetical protein